MNDLTVLSDAELDAVAGGWGSFNPQLNFVGLQVGGLVNVNQQANSSGRTSTGGNSGNILEIDL